MGEVSINIEVVCTFHPIRWLCHGDQGAEGEARLGRMNSPLCQLRTSRQLPSTTSTLSAFRSERWPGGMDR